MSGSETPIDHPRTAIVAAANALLDTFATADPDQLQLALAAGDRARIAELAGISEADLARWSREAFALGPENIDRAGPSSSEGSNLFCSALTSCADVPRRPAVRASSTDCVPNPEDAGGSRPLLVRGSNPRAPIKGKPC
jgi:hypothetical protein